MAEARPPYLAAVSGSLALVGRTLRHPWVQGAWIFLLAVFAITVGARYSRQFAEGLASVGWLALMVSIALVFAAKLCFARFATDVLAAVSEQPCRFAFGFYAYNVSQIAKYLPGNIWQHASRAAIYRHSGLSGGRTATAVAAEIAGLLTSAFFTGGVFMALSDAGSERMRGLWAASGLPEPSPLLAAIGIAFAVIAALSIAVTLRSLWGGARLVAATGMILRSAVWLSLAWLLLGSSMTLLLPATTDRQALLIPVAGLFAFAFAAGFLAPFAPAGIGVREAVMVFGLSPFLEPPAILVAVASHRLIYVVSDVALAVSARAVAGSAGRRRERRDVPKDLDNVI